MTEAQASATRLARRRPMTRARRLRRSFDLVLASHHYYGPKMGLRRLSRHFSLPRSTVRDAIHRVETGMTRNSGQSPSGGATCGCCRGNWARSSCGTGSRCRRDWRTSLPMDGEPHELDNGVLPGR